MSFSWGTGGGFGSDSFGGGFGGGFGFGNTGSSFGSGSGGGFSLGGNSSSTGSGFGFGASTGSGWDSGFGASTGSGFGFGSSTGSGFGSTGSGFGFGASSSSGFGFGSNTGSGFGFGNSSTGSGFGFGSGSSGSGFGFGNSNTGSGFGFGGSTGSGFGFGGSSSGGFGFGQPQPSTGFSFGSSSSGGFGQTVGGQSTMFAGASMLGNETDILEKKTTELERAFHQESPDCRFHIVLYNKLAAGQPPARRPDNLSKLNSRLWEEAERNNPEPKSLFPIQAIGFSDLLKRVAARDKATDAYQAAVQNFQSSILNMQQEHELNTKVQIAELRQTHSKLANQLLRVMTQVEMLKTRDNPLLSPEIDFRRQLETLKAELAKPTQFQGRVTELASIARIQDERPSEHQAVDMDSDNQRSVFEVLQEQNQGLQHLTSLLRKDLRDMASIAQGMEEMMNKIER